MILSALTPVVRYLARLESSAAGDVSDAELLERFRRGGEEAAFTLLVQRHGPSVLGVCRRVLGNATDADDAFQATFLVLLRKANAVRRTASLGCWLYGIAWRVAAKARARRISTEPLGDRFVSHGGDPSEEVIYRELSAVLDEEIRNLPQKYRAPLVLCGPGEKTCEQAACELGWPKSTVIHRLTRAREELRRRLALRGIAVPAALLATLLAKNAMAARVPTLLTLATVRVARQAATKSVATMPAMALADQVMREAALIPWLVALGLAAAVGLAGATAFSFAGANATLPEAIAQEQPTKAANRAPDPERDEFPLPAEALARVGSARLRHGKLFLSNLNYSPDGMLLATTDSVRVRLWDANTGKLVRQITPPGGIGQGGLFSADGKTIVVFNNGVCHWFDIHTGQEAASCNVKFTGPRGVARFSPRGQTLAVFEPVGDIGLHELPSGKERLRLVAEGSWFGECAFSEDGKVLAAVELTGKPAPEDHRIRLFDVKTGQSLCNIDPGEIFRGLTLSPDGKEVLAHNLSKSIRIWRVPTGELLHKIEVDVNALAAAAFAPDGNSIVVGSQSINAIRIDLATGKELARYCTHSPSSTRFAFTPNGKTLAVGVVDGMVSQWDLGTGKRLEASADFVAAISPVRFDSTGRGLELFDGDLVTLDWRSGKALRRMQLPYRGASLYFYTAVSSDRSRWAGINAARNTGVWDIATGKELCVLAAAPGTWLGPAFSPDGKLIYTVQWDGPVRVWDAATGKERPPFDTGRHFAQSLSISPNGRRLAVVDQPHAGQTARREIIVWDLSTGRERWRLLPPEERWASTLIFSPDSDTLVAIGGDKWVYSAQRIGFISIWDLRTGKTKLALTGPAASRDCAAFSSDGRTLVTGDQDGGVGLWEVITGQQRHSFPGHESYVYSVAFSPDDKFVASVGCDAPVFVWDVEGRSGKPPSAAHLTGEEAASLWDTLRDGKAAAAFGAMRELLAHPESAVILLRERLRPTPAVDDKTIRRLLRDLDDDAFAVRQKAATDLEAIVDSAEPFLRKALEEKPSIGAKRQIEDILEAASLALPERRCQVRAIEVVERLGTAEARKLLATLGKGAEGALLTREARGAMERLKGR
jgi:RNA polymerase sigma factor (sigma-70 family)